MSLPPFDLVNWFSAAEGRFDLSLGHSDCEPLSINDIVDTADLTRFAEAQLGYQPFSGMPELRAAIAEQYTNIRPEHVLVCNGSSEPIYTFMRAVLGPQDEVIVPQPLFHTLHTIARAIGCRIVEWRATDEYECRFDVNRLKELCTGRTRLIVINFPHNPSGRLISREQLQEIVALAESSNALLFSDEVFRLLELPPHKTLPAACDLSESAVSISGLSKPHGLGGLRIGWIATRRQDVLDCVKRYRFYTTEMTGMPPQWLACRALAQQQSIVSANRARIADNLNLLQQLAARRANVLQLTVPEAGTMAIARQRTGLSGTSFCERLLEDQRLLVIPGRLVGLPDDALRIGLGRADFPQAIERLDEYLQQV
jgi:aspartate/methionine/tyrosine aminotransferase